MTPVSTCVDVFSQHVKLTWLSLWKTSSLTSCSTSLFSAFQCLPADKLAIYGVSEQSRLDGQGFLELCPTMLQQLDAGSCRLQDNEELSGDASPRPTGAEGKLWILTHVDSFWNYWKWNTKGVTTKSWIFYILKDNSLMSSVALRWIVEKDLLYEQLLTWCYPLLFCSSCRRLGIHTYF